MFGEALKDAFVGLGYIANWVQIYGHHSSHGPLTHLWSLAVEEQFYVFWAPLLLVIVAIAARFSRTAGAGRKWLAITALVLGIASLVDAGVHFFLLASVHDQRVTYGSDTRAAAFLFGGAIAVGWSTSAAARVMARVRRSMPADGPSLSKPLVEVIVLAVSCGLLLAGRIEGDAQGDLVKTFAFVAVTILAPILIAVLLWAPGSMIGRLLSHPVAVYIGKRSYALYLWHYVLLTWLYGLGFVGELAALAASFACAELSWRLVESRALAMKDRWFSTAATKPDPVREAVPALRSDREGELVTSAAS